MFPMENLISLLDRRKVSERMYVGGWGTMKLLNLLADSSPGRRAMPNGNNELVATVFWRVAAFDSPQVNRRPGDLVPR